MAAVKTLLVSLFMFVFFGAVFPITAPAAEPAAPAYEAVYNLPYREAGATNLMTVWFDGKSRYRADQTKIDDAFHVVTGVEQHLSDIKEGKTYTVFNRHTEKVLLKKNFDIENDPWMMNHQYDSQFASLGHKLIGIYNCNGWRQTTGANGRPVEPSLALQIWTIAGRSCPVYAKQYGRPIMVLKTYREKTMSPKWFDLPEGYRVVESK